MTCLMGMIASTGPRAYLKKGGSDKGADAWAQGQPLLYRLSYTACAMAGLEPATHG